jgi:Na+/phosphate symporter
MTISISLLSPVAIVLGLVLIFVTNNGKINRVGEICLLAGMMAFLFNHK